MIIEFVRKKVFLSILGSVMICLMLSGPASGSDIRLVSASSLNVREKPNRSAKIIKSLVRGSVVAVKRSSGAWSEVMFLDGPNQKPRFGWVASAYLVPFRKRIPGGSPSLYGDDEVQKEDANYSLEITNVNFKCKEGIFDNGFDKCLIDIDVSVSTDYRGSDNPNVDFSCDVDLALADSKGWPSRKSDSDSGSVWVSYGSGTDTLNMSIRVAGIFDPIVSAKIKDITCSIQHIW